MEVEAAIQELEASLKAIRKIYKKTVSNLVVLKIQAETDELTKLLRRGSFMLRLNRILSGAIQRKSEVHVMMIDLDHFKSINDVFGHQTGDEVLEKVSQLVRNYLRPSDLAGRYGGEELILAVECDRLVALGIAERIRQALEHSVFTAARIQAHNSGAQAPDREQFSVTMSLGIASTSEFGFDATTLINQADRVLYEAKRRGRNRVVFAAKAA